MKITFLGTRGEIEARTDKHFRHASTMICYRRRRVMIDCGADWLEQVHRLRPHAIVITHAHPDHAYGLQNGAPCGVWATQQAWELLDDYPIRQRRVVRTNEPATIEGITFEAFPVEHSIRCPAVGYRISASRVSIFYVPDVVYIYDRAAALRGVSLYIGDGASLQRSMVRKYGDRLAGHTPVRTQLTWCEKEGVAEAIFTHCGSQVVTGDEDQINEKLRQLAQQRGIKAGFAYDGLDVVLR